MKISKLENNYVQSCGTLIENRIDIWINEWGAMAYGIPLLRITETPKMMPSPRMQNPPQRSENGLFLCFGRGVFFVNALEEKLPDRRKKRERGGGRKDVIR